MTRRDHRGARQTRVDDEAALVKAERLFSARGYRRTSVQDIVDGTGMRRDRIYGAYGDKQGLFLTVLERYRQKSRLYSLAQHARSSSSPLQAILDTFAIVADEAARGAGCLAISAALDPSPNAPVVAMAARRALSDINDNLRIAIEAGKAAGEIGAEVEAEQVAGALLALLVGVHVLGRSRHEPASAARAVAAQAATLLTPPASRESPGNRDPRP